MATTKKLDDFTLEVTEDVPPPRIVTHEVKFLKSQLEAVIAQRDAFAAARKVEIDYLRGLIQAAKDLNIKEREENVEPKKPL
jgi:hypothetical protein